MVRFLVLYNKPNDVEAFEHHYHTVHIPLAKKLANLRHYKISKNTSPIRGGEPYYRIAELEWDNMEALKKDFASPQGQETARDMANLEMLSPGVHSMIYELEDV